MVVLCLQGKGTCKRMINLVKLLDLPRQEGRLRESERREEIVVKA